MYVQRPPAKGRASKRPVSSEVGAVTMCLYIPADMAATLEYLAKQKGHKTVSAYVRTVFSANREVTQTMKDRQPLEIAG